jgi:NADH dehydrogenase FAD-containing subunit
MYPIQELFDKYPAEVRAGFEFVLGKATAVDIRGKTVYVTEQGAETERHIAYDYLVISSGSTAKATLGGASLKVPFKSSKDGNTDIDIKNAQDAVQAAKSVIIGGAGAVGVEFAAELAEERPDVKIILVTPTERVLPTLKNGPRSKAEKVLKAKGIEIVTKEAVEAAHFDSLANNWTVILTSGNTMTADVYIHAAGVVPNNEFIPSALLDEDGWVEVDRHFRASRIPLSANIYAVGDITSNAQRIASRMSTITGAVVSNLRADILGKGARSTFDAAKQSVFLAVPLGKSDGTGQLGWFVFPGFVLAIFKGKDYMTGMGKKLVSG